MIGIILAAGAGRRLRPLTDGVPKTLAPVSGELTILDTALANLRAADVREAVIVVGYRAEAVLDRAKQFEARYELDLQFVHNDHAEDRNNCYSLWLARYVASRSDDPAYPVRPGDNLVMLYYIGTTGGVLDRATIDATATSARTGAAAGHPTYAVLVELPRGTARTVTLTLTEPTSREHPVVLRQPMVNPISVVARAPSC